MMKDTIKRIILDLIYGKPARCYFNKIEIDKLHPRLDFLDQEDWYGRWMEWIPKQNGWDKLYVLYDKDPDHSNDAKVISAHASTALTEKETFDLIIEPAKFVSITTREELAGII